MLIPTSRRAKEREHAQRVGLCQNKARPGRSTCACLLLALLVADQREPAARKTRER